VAGFLSLFSVQEILEPASFSDKEAPKNKNKNFFQKKYQWKQ
jgi:hypothetical protein